MRSAGRNASWKSVRFFQDRTQDMQRSMETSFNAFDQPPSSLQLCILDRLFCLDSNVLGVAMPDPEMFRAR